jgi:hypothetical protein
MARQKIWPDGKAALEYAAKHTGRDRRVPPINDAIQDIARRPVYVFNVGPWGFRENGGSFGYQFIPACEIGAPMEWERLKATPGAPGVYVPDHWEEGELRVTDPRTQYAACKPLPGLMMEPMPNTQEDCVWNMQDTGEYFARETLLKIGVGHSKRDSNVRKGVFLGKDKTPAAEELKAARAELFDLMTEAILDADRAWAAGPAKAEQVIRPEIHHVCADWLNLTDRDWLRGTKPQGRIKCEMCGLLVDEGIATCQNGHIVDAAAYKRAYAQQEAIKKSLAVL